MIKYRKCKPFGCYELLKSYTLKTKVKIDHIVVSGCISLTHRGYLLIETGYEWDGASGAINTPNYARASLVHDALYELMRARLIPLSSRRAADKLLREICIEDGMTKLRAWNAYLWVRLFGKSSAAPQDNYSLMERKE